MIAFLAIIDVIAHSQLLHAGSSPCFHASINCFISPTSLLSFWDSAVLPCVFSRISCLRKTPASSSCTAAPMITCFFPALTRADGWFIVDKVSKCMTRTRSSVQLTEFNFPIGTGILTVWISLSKGVVILLRSAELIHLASGPRTQV